MSQANEQTNEEIAQAIGETGDAFDKAITAAVSVLIEINTALVPYRSKLPQELRTVVDAITAMQNAGAKK